VPLLYGTLTFMRDTLNELIEKWQDVIDSSDDRTERTLAAEAVEDLKDLRKALRGCN